MPKKIVSNHKFAVYKNKPLIRCNDIIYYGNISDPYVIKLEILNYKSMFNKNVADKVSVQLLSTDDSLNKRKRIIKKCEKDGLYMALDIAHVWLCKALSEE